MKKKFLQFFTIILILTCCKKILPTNPFDSECPKELFTPSSFKAFQSSNGIELNWDKVENNISGFKIIKILDNGTPNIIAILPKDSSHFCDSSISLGKIHKYSLFAYAGNNESNSVNVEILPIVVVKTTIPTLITTDSATLGGLISAASGNTVTTNGISWRVANSNSITTSSIQGGAGSFNLTITNLLPNTKYFYSAFAITNQNKRMFGKEISFTTNPLSTAVINTLTPSSITSSYATVGGIITYNGGSTITESGIVYSKSQNPTINNTKIINTTTNNSFTTTLTGLTQLTTYYVRAYAINNQGISYGYQINFTTAKKTINTGSVSDVDGNTYNTVTIGSQVWMTSNLKTTKFNNGTPIPNITDSLIWNNATSSGYCWYNNSISNKQPYGALYNYYSVNTSNLCPTGWHIPSDVEWDTLISFLGGSNVAGGKMKEVGNTHWVSPNIGATNSSVFTALPSGARDGYYFNYLTNSGVWWSSTLVPSNNPSYTIGNNYTLTNSSVNVYKQVSMKSDGNAVRCVGD